MKNIFCIILLMSRLWVYGQQEIKDEYEFPVKPGSKEWIQLESIQKCIEVSQMPDEALVKISTADLLETCLKFPFLINIFFYDNYQQGFERMTSQFNGFGELFKRPDLIDALLNKYKNLRSDVKTIRLQKDVEQGGFTFRQFVLEFILAQDVVVNNLSAVQEKELFLLSNELKQIKNDYSDVYGNWHVIPINLLYIKKAVNTTGFIFESEAQRKGMSAFIQAPTLIEQQQIKNIEDYVNAKYK